MENSPTVILTMYKYLITLCLLASNTCFAISIATFEGFHIIADTTVVNVKSGNIIYKGNVEVTKAGMSFTADMIEEYRSNKKLIKLVAVSKPVVFINSLPTVNEIAKGETAKLVYTGKDNQLTLTDFNLIDGSGNTYRGKQGDYLLEE